MAAALADLGSPVTLARFDLGDLDTAALAAAPPTVIVIDAGDELARALRTVKKVRSGGALAEVPILVALPVARLPGLDVSAGFDDFVLTPLVPAELYARVRQLDWRAAAFDSDELVKIDDLVIDLAGHEARLAGRGLGLTHQEFELLAYLAQHRGRAFTRDQLLETVWGYTYTGGTRTVDIHVRRLRAKLGPSAGDLIETVRNLGYKMRSRGR
ncbi:MAG: response regulator transcription factor [Myxococcales bacterium]|nr:response regulator transcription factor [Myxococcales bacterium]MBK7198049.1 response regulator transcription factor [Myxococcales bacterium]MBP6845421.1 response regulator transcription factor [Kofleriaceae bacterium]